MREILKTILLTALVALSLFQTYQLWYGQQPPEMVVEDEYEQIIVVEPRPLEEVIKPKSIVIPAEGGFILLNRADPDFNRIWSALFDLLEIYSEDSLVARDSEFVKNQAETVLTVFFNPGLPTGEDAPWINVFPGRLITRIDLIAEDDNLYMLSWNDDDFMLSITLSDSRREELQTILGLTKASERYRYQLLTEELALNVLGRNIAVQKEIYIPPEPFYMNRLSLHPESFNRDLLLKTFFVDYNLVRIIEEKDGGLIFSDGEKGLRITLTGLEYSNPRYEDGKVSSEIAATLINGNNLISYHGGWPEGLQLEEMSLIRRGESSSYQLEWRLDLGGYPLYTANPTRMRFNDRGLVHYSRSLFFQNAPGSAEQVQVQVSGWAEALDAALDLFETDLPGLRYFKRIDNMHLGYAVISVPPGGYTGEPVWFIKISGNTYILKADSLVRITEGELE